MSRHATCAATGKRRYRTMESAEHAFAQIILHGRAIYRSRRAYECPHCKGWHLTSEEKRRHRV
jgi:hypothetical protein